MPILIGYGDTINRLLVNFVNSGKKIPLFKEAMLIIDEHCNIKNRQVFDQDNKGWKAVSNVLKGRVFPDDDQFSMGISLISTKDKNLYCDIYVIEKVDAGDFFNLHAINALY